jgi:hypothetical protein
MNVTVGRVKTAEVIERFATVAEGENYVATTLTETDPEGVERGDYFIDGPEPDPEKQANDLEPVVIDYGELAQLGYANVTIHYHGSGDEGFIEDIYSGKPDSTSDYEAIQRDLFEKLRYLGYALLEEHYGGWENDSGASGDIVIDVQARKTIIHHGWIVESTQNETKEI